MRLRVSHSLRNALLTVFAALLLGACGNGANEPALVEITGPTMGTYYSVKIADPPGQVQTTTVREIIESALDNVSRGMSTYDKTSELSRFNASRETGWIPASTELLTVLREALHISALSDGAFDVTVAPMVDLWGFGPVDTGDRVPTEEEIRAAAASTGYTRLSIRSTPPALRKDHPDTRIDLSSIAKGYAVDVLAEQLEALGISNYLVEIGGELRGKGHNRRGEQWRIGIETPSTGKRMVYTVVAIDDIAVATSGDYRNYFEQDGRRYSHTIDPVTGRPITHKLASVTVVGRSTMQADAMATALMVLGPDKGYALAEREGLAACFIIRGAHGFTDRQTTAFSRHTAERRS
ncbi:MAG: FAD:protein FMN transferase [Gammaproteobacteria bacterium]